MDLLIMDVNFLQWVQNYNSFHGSEECLSLYRQRVTSAWVLFSIHQKIALEFPVIRNDARNLDIEAICRLLYPRLKEVVDRKWLTHICEQCSTRLVVLDGNQKCFRPVCASKGEKIIRPGHLNQFTGTYMT